MDELWGVPLYRTRFLAEQRVAFALRTPNSFCIITGVTDAGPPTTPFVGRRLFSRYTLGEKERLRDRRKRKARGA